MSISVKVSGNNLCRSSWKGGHIACLSLVADTALMLAHQHKTWLEQGQVGDEKLITVTEDERCFNWYRIRLSAEHYDSLFYLLETELRKLGFDDFMAEFYTLLVVNNLRKEVSRAVRAENIRRKAEARRWPHYVQPSAAYSPRTEWL